MATDVIVGAVLPTVRMAEATGVPESVPSVGVTSQYSWSPTSKSVPLMVCVVATALMPTYHCQV